MLRRQQDARIDMSEREYNKTKRQLHSIFQTSKYPNIPMLCTNDNLPEMRHLDQDFYGSCALGRVRSGVS